MDIKPMRYQVVMEGDRSKKVEWLMKKLDTPTFNKTIGLCIDYCYEIMAKGKSEYEAIPKLYYKDQIDYLKKEQKNLSRELLKATDDKDKARLRQRARDIREQLNTAMSLYKFEADVEGNISNPVEKFKIALTKEQMKEQKLMNKRKMLLEVFKAQQDLVKKGVKAEIANAFGQELIGMSDEDENEYTVNID